MQILCGRLGAFGHGRQSIDADTQMHGANEQLELKSEKLKSTIARQKRGIL